jgi:putative PIN family toxin of toxin-antitoxin system
VRAVLDTNVVVSALLWGGTPERLIELAGEGGLELITSESLLAEFAGILGRGKFAEKLRRKDVSASDLVARYRTLAKIDALERLFEGMLDGTCSDQMLWELLGPAVVKRGKCGQHSP